MVEANFSNPTLSVRGLINVKFFSNASLIGWGSICGARHTHGWRSDEKKILHINVLELGAAFCALKCFTSDLQNCECSSSVRQYYNSSIY